MRQSQQPSALTALQYHRYQENRVTQRITINRLEVLTGWAWIAYGSSAAGKTPGTATAQAAGGGGNCTAAAGAGEAVRGPWAVGGTGSMGDPAVAAGTAAAAAFRMVEGAVATAGEEGIKGDDAGNKSAASKGASTGEEGKQEEEQEDETTALRTVLRGMAAGVQSRTGAALAHLADAMLSVPGAGLEGEALGILKRGILPCVSRYSSLIQTYQFSPLVTPLYRNLYRRLAVRLAGLVQQLRAAAVPPVASVPAAVAGSTAQNKRGTQATPAPGVASMEVDEGGGEEGPVQATAGKRGGSKAVGGKGGKRSRGSNPAPDDAPAPTTDPAATAVAVTAAAAATIAASGPGPRRSSRSRGATPATTPAPSPPADGEDQAAPANPSTGATPTGLHEGATAAAPSTSPATGATADDSAATATDAGPVAGVPAGGHPWSVLEASRLLALAEPVLGDLARTMVMSQVCDAAPFTFL